MGVTLLAVILATALSATANNISEQCQVHNGRRITCSCVGNEEFFLPEDYHYQNITSITITECVSAYLHFSSLPEANDLEEFIVQNISGRLDFDIYITSHRMKLLRLANIGRIPQITNYTFTTLKDIHMLEIKDTLIENFQEDLSFITLSHFIMTNVTIERIHKLNISKGKTLHIVNSVLRITTSLNFDFLNIEIVDSKFELQKPGLVSIQGNVTVVRNSIFSNASMNLVAGVIMISDICADGKSTLRLKAESINSSNNRLPNEITYSRDNYRLLSEMSKFTNRNNTVCKAGNCKCTMSRGQAPRRRVIPEFILGCLLVVLLPRSFY